MSINTEACDYVAHSLTLPKQQPLRVIPFFDDTIVLLPEYKARILPELINTIDFFSVQVGSLLLLPATWQLEPNIHHTLRHREMFSFAGSTKNIPLGIEVLAQTGIDHIITYSSCITEIIELLQQRQLPNSVKCITNILSPEEIDSFTNTWHNETTIPVHHEIHIAPGYPIATTRRALINPATLHFDLLPSYQITVQNGYSLLSGLSDLALPITDYQLPTAYLF